MVGPRAVEPNQLPGGHVRNLLWGIVSGGLLWLPSLGSAQTQTSSSGATRDTTKPKVLQEVTVTATRGGTPVFRVPNPVILVDSLRIRASLANGVGELLREEPGVDFTGTGPNQGRPVIRGQRGQRILLLEDGIRLNNTRRQQEFGELPALVGLASLSRIEVVRGPLSVLYGTDAIGGVVNLIPMRPRYGGAGARVRGALEYRYSTTDEQQHPSGSLFGEVGSFGFGVTGSYRKASPYSAPAGRFGDLTLASDTRVQDTGLKDATLGIEAGYGFSEGHSLSARYSRYQADDVGFGYVDNADLGTPDAPTVVIRYPEQRYNKVSLSYRGNALALPFADRAEVTVYRSGNTRTLTNHVFVPFGPGTPPGAGVEVDTRNLTDIVTTGYRIEVSKVLGRQLLTFGTDFFRDRSDNTDSSSTTVFGFGPPSPEVSDTALTPNAAFRSIGVFAQGELQLTERLSAVLGARWQDVEARTRPTPRVTTALVEAHDHTVVGAANLSYRVIEGVNLIAAIGRAFRAPNLIERFFNGPTPEGAGYQIQNPELKPETSLELDLGVKVARGRFQGEGFGFRNEVRNAIRVAPTGEQIGSFDAFQNVNVDKLRTRGLELWSRVELELGFYVGGSYTRISSKDVLDPSNPVGDSYSSKLTGRFGWRQQEGRFWGEYGLRHNGTRKDVALGQSPIGPVLPAFTVHSLRGGARLFRIARTTHELTVVVDNLTNRLYAEFGNASFFRPEPKRSLAFGWTTTF
jgi:outer membrane receptor protein involved in Fe transport